MKMEIYWISEKKSNVRKGIATKLLKQKFPFPLLAKYLGLVLFSENIFSGNVGSPSIWILLYLRSSLFAVGFVQFVTSFSTATYAINIEFNDL